MDFGTQQCWPDGANTCGGGANTDGRSYIRDLSPGSSNYVLVGIVISKLSVHSFPDKKNPGTERYSLGFTLRDSPTDFINVTCWGSETFITDNAKSFKLNDIVEVRNPQVSPKQGSDFEHQWKPWTPSNFQLNISETFSTVSLHSGWDVSEFNQIIHTPIKESGDYCALVDIMSSGQSVSGDHMNVLVVVKNVDTPKDIVTKKGKQIQKCDIQLFDETCHSYSMTLWDEERIEFALTWTPGETVLFIADLKIIYDNYRKTMSSVCDNKAIITINPDIRQAHKLYSYAQSPEVVNDLAMDNAEDRSQFSLDGIKDMFTIEQIKQAVVKANTQLEAVSGIVFAYLTNFNIDGNVDQVLALRCNKCRRRVNFTTGHCENTTCNDQNNGEPQLSYDLLINFSDHSGTLTSCRLNSSALETMLGYSVSVDIIDREENCMEYLEKNLRSTGENQQHYPHESQALRSNEPGQFRQLPTTAVTEFKLKYLLEKCKFYFKISGTNNSVLVLSCALADPEDIIECTKV